MATAAARLLHLAGFSVLILERKRPLAVRRLVCFAEAVTHGEATVEGVLARRVGRHDMASAGGRFVPVVVDAAGTCLPEFGPAVLVDGRMAKQNLGTRRGQARLVIGLGPGFHAGRDVDAVVETQRGPHLGRVLWEGPAEPDSSVPAAVAGHAEARVLRAPCAGTFRGRVTLGAIVTAGQVLGEVDGHPVAAAIPGLLRGLLADGVEVGEGVKVGDVDPRGAAVDAARVSDKARTVAAGVVEAVYVGLQRKSIVDSR
jgi:xanthine dehydrogenase accessory factor